MNVSSEELRAAGFRRAGTVFPDATRVVRVQVDWAASGFVVYLMVVNHEVKKAGTTGRKNSTFEGRMHSTFSALRRVIIDGPPYLGDPFKQYAPAAILAGQEVELWAQELTVDTFEAKETELNSTYRGEWAKEGWTKGGRRLFPDESSPAPSRPGNITKRPLDFERLTGSMHQGRARAGRSSSGADGRERSMKELRLDATAFEERLNECGEDLQRVVAYLRTTAANAGAEVSSRPYVPKTGWGITYYIGEQWFCQFHPKHQKQHV